MKEADDKSFKVSFYSSKFGFMNGGEGTFDKNGNLYDDGIGIGGLCEGQYCEEAQDGYAAENNIELED